MRNIILSVLVIVLISLIAGCNDSHQTILDKKVIENRNITFVQVSLDYNANPKGKNEAKLITDKNEIASLIKAFENAYIEKEIDTVYGNRSVFRFFEGNDLVIELYFSVGFNHAFYNKSNCYSCVFKGEDPWKLYMKSTEEIIFVDKYFNKVE